MTWRLAPCLKAALDEANRLAPRRLGLAAPVRGSQSFAMTYTAVPVHRSIGSFVPQDVVALVGMALRAMRLRAVLSTFTGPCVLVCSTRSTRHAPSIADHPRRSQQMPILAVSPRLFRARRHLGWRKYHDRQLHRGTVSARPSGVSSPPVLLHRYRFQVCRVHTVANTAEVVDLMPGGNGPDEPLKGVAMSRRLCPTPIVTSNGEHAVSVGPLTSNPKPATRSIFFDSRPETLVIGEGSHPQAYPENGDR